MGATCCGANDDAPITVQTKAYTPSGPTTTTFNMADWYRAGQYHDTYSTENVPKIETSHLKGEKLTVTGVIVWQDQGFGNKKGSFRLKLVRNGEEVEGSAQKFGPAEHSRDEVQLDFSDMCAHWVEGDEIVAEVYVGGGGGHQLTIHEAKLDITAE